VVNVESGAAKAAMTVIAATDGTEVDRKDRSEVRMTNDAKTYRRDDGVLMIEVQPGQFINERAASNFANRKPTTDTRATSVPKRGNYGVKRTKKSP
jgi:hypothetical protein